MERCEAIVIVECEEVTQPNSKLTIPLQVVRQKPARQISSEAGPIRRIRGLTNAPILEPCSSTYYTSPLKQLGGTGCFCESMFPVSSICFAPLAVTPSHSRGLYDASTFRLSPQHRRRSDSFFATWSCPSLASSALRTHPHILPPRSSHSRLLSQRPLVPDCYVTKLKSTSCI
jgi:hypothetical protein